jgi:hypothetical protein
MRSHILPHARLLAQQYDASHRLAHREQRMPSWRIKVMCLGQTGVNGIFN